MVFERTGTRTSLKISRIALDRDRSTQDQSWVVRSQSGDWSRPVHCNDRSTDRSIAITGPLTGPDQFIAITSLLTGPDQFMMNDHSGYLLPQLTVNCIIIKTTGVLV